MVVPVTTVEQLLDAALVAVSRHGTRRLSMEDVATAAGVSRQTLYRHFGSKAELLDALAIHLERRFEERLRKEIAAELEPRAQLDAALRALVGFLDTHVGQHLVDAEPAFVLERLRLALDEQATAMDRALHDALRSCPAVRDGSATTAGVADLILRVTISHFLFPHRDPGALLSTLQALVLGR